MIRVGRDSINKYRWAEDIEFYQTSESDQHITVRGSDFGSKFDNVKLITDVNCLTVNTLSDVIFRFYNYNRLDYPNAMATAHDMIEAMKSQCDDDKIIRYTLISYLNRLYDRTFKIGGKHV